MHGYILPIARSRYCNLLNYGNCPWRNSVENSPHSPSVNHCVQVPGSDNNSFQSLSFPSFVRIKTRAKREPRGKPVKHPGGIN